MKKGIIFALSLVVSIAFCSCGSDEENDNIATKYPWVLITNDAASDITSLTVTVPATSTTDDLLEGETIPAGESMLIVYDVEDATVTAYLTAKILTGSDVTSPTFTLASGQLADCHFDGTAFTNTIHDATEYQDIIDDNYSESPAKSPKIRRVKIK